MSNFKQIFKTLFISSLLISQLNCFSANKTIFSNKNPSLLTSLITNMETMSLMKESVTEPSGNCVQIQCKFICLHGKSTEIDKNIREVTERNKEPCPIVEELSIYNYEFPNQTIERGFLGVYGKRVSELRIAGSTVTAVEGGAFGNGIFQKLIFENLSFEKLDKNLFEGITNKFQRFIFIQRNKALSHVSPNFLDHVKYQIKHLSLQAGLNCVKNITASENLLNNLIFVDFSYNNFSDQFLPDTFSKLSMVEYLDLSNSQISYVPDYVFADLIDTLKYINLSDNHLKTVSRLIFGWREIPRDVQIVMENNEWHCSCDLHNQMSLIYLYALPNLFCAEPREYQGWSVCDERLCVGLNTDDDEQNVAATRTTPPYKVNSTATTMIPFLTSTTTRRPTTPETTSRSTGPPEVSTPNKNEGQIIQLECRKGPSQLEVLKQCINSHSLTFSLTYKPVLRVDILIEPGQQMDLHSLIWFSKATKQYYKMELNYDDFELGCYGKIAHITTVEQLLPNVAYTFCLVLRNQQTVSPFSCQSIHVKSNLDVSYNAWVTSNIGTTSISLIIFGIIIFTFIGILMVLMVLKHKPTLLKGSKRIRTTGSNSKEIVVLPKGKTKDGFKLKNGLQPKRNTKSKNNCMNRRDSTGSTVSYESYINNNLYEVIPVYLKFARDFPAAQQNRTYYDFENQFDRTYMTPLARREPKSSYIDVMSTTDSTANLVSYAEIPHRTKRTSNDPLPEIPQNEQPFIIDLYDSTKKHNQL